MLPFGFEAIIPASERPQTHVLDGAVTGLAVVHELEIKFMDVAMR